MIRKRKHQTSQNQMNRLIDMFRALFVSDLIQNGIEVGMTIPGERVIAGKYAIPLSVVRIVLQQLKEEGILETKQRCGTCLKKVPAHSGTLQGKRFAMVGFLEEPNPAALLTGTNIISTMLEPELNAEGITLDFLNTWTPDESDRIPEIYRTLIERKYDAVFVIFAVHEKSLMNCPKLPMPVILYDEEPFESSFDLYPRIQFDQEQFSRTQVNYLKDRGHRNLAYFGRGCFDWGRNRAAYVSDEAVRLGLPPVKVYFHDEDLSGIPEALHNLPDDVTAIIADNDEMAFRIIQTAEKEKIRIPEQLSLISADNYVQYRALNLTTVDRSWLKLGRAAFAYLKKKILAPEQKSNDRSIYVDCAIISRSTVLPVGEMNRKITARADDIRDMIFVRPVRPVRPV